MSHADTDIIAKIAREEPDFFHHVEQARRNSTSIQLILNASESTKEIAWACLWYALNRGVMITFAPFIVVNRREESVKDVAPIQASKGEELPDYQIAVTESGDLAAN